MYFKKNNLTLSFLLLFNSYNSESTREPIIFSDLSMEKSLFLTPLLKVLIFRFLKSITWKFSFIFTFDK